jgi:hypothetical protein
MRRRIRKACEPCRHRKVKCDGVHPCDVCVGYGYSCVYANSEVSAVEQVSISSVKLPLSPTVPRSQEQLSAASDSLLTVNGEPQRQLYVLSEERQFPMTGNTRFTRVDSAIAFPRSLGLSLNADDLPRLQAIAWNSGTRVENLEVIQPNIFHYITLDDLETFPNTFFTSVNQIFDILNHEEFNHRVTRCWETQNIDDGFGVVLSGVMALGSLFSAHHTLTHEAEIVEQARLILDKTFAHSGVLLSVDFVVGWILRAIYLRSTTKPHVSWVASCMAMHIAESIGLHQEMSEIKTSGRAQSQSRVMTETEIETRRRTFWAASSLNRLFSAQYGRTMITLQNIGCRYPIAVSGDGAENFISFIRLLPDLCDATNSASSSAVVLLTEGLLRVSRVAIHKLPLILLRADAVFCIYRKLRYIGVTLSPIQIEVVLSVIRSALGAADSLALQLQQWWTIVGVPFHSICVLIALNTMESLTLLHKAMETLQNITNTFSSRRSKEALSTAHQLVKAAEKKRRGELECLQRCLNLNTRMTTSTAVQTPSSEEQLDLPLFEWPTDDDLGFLDFLGTGHANQDPSIAGGFDA